MTAFPARLGSWSALSLLALALTGCGGGSPSTTEAAAATPSAAAVPIACRQPAPPDLPGADAQVTDTDSGAFCLGTSQQIDAFLTTTTTANRWAPITSSDRQILGNGDNSVLTAPVTVTAGVFVARKPGTAMLSSTRPDGSTWQVTIVVR